MYMFNWKRARAQLKHTHAQLKAGICTTEACICWYVGVKRAYAQLVACTCSQLREKSWTQKNCFCTRNARFFHLNILQGTQATCWFQKWKCPIFQWNIPQTLFWNDIYYMRENVKVKMLQKCIFELIYEQNHTLCPGTSREKMKKKKTFFIFVYIETFHKLCSEMIFTSCGKM